MSSLKEIVYKDILEKILFSQYKGKKYQRLIVSRNFKLSFFEKLRKFQNADLSFSNDYLFSIKRKNVIYDIYNLPKSQITYNLTLMICEGRLRVLTDEEIRILSNALEKESIEERENDECLDMILDDEDIEPFED
jgi:hypothetical protein